MLVEEMASTFSSFLQGTIWATDLMAAHHVQNVSSSCCPKDQGLIKKSRGTIPQTVDAVDASSSGSVRNYNPTHCYGSQTNYTSLMSTCKNLRQNSRAVVEVSLVSAGITQDEIEVARNAVDGTKVQDFFFGKQTMGNLTYDLPMEREMLILERARLEEMERAGRLNCTEEKNSASVIPDNLDHESDDELALQELENLEHIIKELEKKVSSYTQSIGRAHEEAVGSSPEEGNAGVTVKSSRRTERLKKQERAHRKVKSIAAAVASKKVAKGKGSTESSGNADPIVNALQGIKKRRLLTASEEVQLSKGVQDLLKLEKMKVEFIDKIGREPTMEEWARVAGIERTVLQQKLWAGKKCKDKMVSCNLGLVATIAKKFQGNGLSNQDLLQEGSIGLIRGVEKFDSTKGFKLSTYAYWWIKQAISRAVALKAKSIRLPVHHYEIISRIRNAKIAFFEKHGRGPEEQELAEFVGLSVTRINTLMNWSKPIWSLDRPIGDGTTTFTEILADETSECTEKVTNAMWLKEDVDKVLHTLKPQEREIIRHRFGLAGGRSKTLEEVGYLYNVTRERIRQIENNAMRKLRQSKQTNGLRCHMCS